MNTALLITAVFTACYALIAKRLSTTVLTAPMLFIALVGCCQQLGWFQPEKPRRCFIWLRKSR
jgi:hypothetical protein